MKKILLGLIYIIINIFISTDTQTAPVPVPTEPETRTEAVSLDFVSNLSCSADYDQLIVVSATGSDAIITMHEINPYGIWEEILHTTGYVGKNGVGKASENDTRTPSGDYALGIAFGVNANPGTSMDYLQVDDTYYWVDDPASSYYNQFITTNEISPDNWDSAEHISDYPDTYAYVLSIDYNTDCVPGEGSAIFLHCSNGKPTLGCVAIPTEDMIFILNHIQKGCHIIIDTPENIANY